MRKCLVTMAYGKHEQYLEISLQSLYRYAKTHDYNLFIPCSGTIADLLTRYSLEPNRPYSWYKIPIMLYLIESGYDNILWIDADIVINKFDKDILSELEDKVFYQSFVVHETSEGFIPNCGVWIINKSASQLLLDIWNQNSFIHHPWWEQKANLHVMNWNQYSAEQTTLTDYGKKSIQLQYEWNIHKNDNRFTNHSIANGRFLHATMYQDILNTMKEWVKNCNN